MNPDMTPPSADDELGMLRREAEELGMPGEITRESVGLPPVTAEEILARLKSRLNEPTAVPIAVPTSSRRQIVLRVVGFAAVIAGVIGLLVNPWHQGSAEADTPPVLDYEFASARNIAYAPGEDAASTLMELASTAHKQPSVPQDGPHQLVVTDNWFIALDDSRDAQLIPKQRELWLRSDGSRQAREVSGRPLAPDGRGLRASKTSRPSGASVETYPAEGLDAQYISKLGTSTETVRTALLDRGECEDRDVGPVRASCLFQEIVSLHDQYVVPPDTAAAFWRVLAAEPTMRSLGAVKDRAGRQGIGISFIPIDAPQFRRVLIISPQNGQLLGTEDILIKSDPNVDLRTPAIYGFTAILSAQYTHDRGPTD